MERSRACVRQLAAFVTIIVRWHKKTRVTMRAAMIAGRTKKTHERSRSCFVQTHWTIAYGRELNSSRVNEVTSPKISTGFWVNSPTLPRLPRKLFVAGGAKGLQGTVFWQKSDNLMSANELQWQCDNMKSGRVTSLGLGMLFFFQRFLSWNNILLRWSLKRWSDRGHRKNLVRIRSVRSFPTSKQ